MDVDGGPTEAQVQGRALLAEYAFILQQDIDVFGGFERLANNRMTYFSVAVVMTKLTNCNLRHFTLILLSCIRHMPALQSLRASIWILYVKRMHESNYAFVDRRENVYLILNGRQGYLDRVLIKREAMLHFLKSLVFWQRLPSLIETHGQLGVNNPLIFNTYLDLMETDKYFLARYIALNTRGAALSPENDCGISDNNNQLFKAAAHAFTTAVVEFAAVRETTRGRQFTHLPLEFQFATLDRFPGCGPGLYSGDLTEQIMYYLFQTHAWNPDLVRWLHPTYVNERLTLGTRVLVLNNMYQLLVNSQGAAKDVYKAGNLPNAVSRMINDFLSPGEYGKLPEDDPELGPVPVPAPPLPGPVPNPPQLTGTTRTHETMASATSCMRCSLPVVGSHV